MWRLYCETQRGKKVWIIRRGRERLPVSKFKRIRDDEAALRELVTRLNANEEDRVRKAVEIRHAYLSPAFLDRYQKFLVTKIPSPEGARQEYSYLYRHFLMFFIAKMGLQNPLDWHRHHEEEWAEYLLTAKDEDGKRLIESAKAKRDVVIAANRFMKWLHKQRPEEVPHLHFEPLTKDKLKAVEAQREMDGDVKETKYIPDSDWLEIRKGAPAEIAAHLKLLYGYGLRRNECLGLKVEDVRQDYLSVERQAPKLGALKPLKSKSKRKTPHWFMKPAEAYALIESLKPMHPRTLSAHFEKLMTDLKLKYTLHDLRHTFITRALRAQPNPVDVQHAVGHKNILTTMGYQHDDRTLGDAPFKPAA